MTQAESAAPTGDGQHSTIPRGLLVTVFVNLVLFGAGVALVGATIPAILRDLQWTYLTVGTVLAAGAVTYLVSTFGCGMLVRRWGPRPIIVAGLLIQAAGLAAFGARAGVAYNICAMGLIGLGEGGTELVSNFCVVRVERGGKSRIMNLMHAAFTLGAVACPLAVGKLLEAGYSWPSMYRSLALLSLAAAAAFARVDFAGVSAPTDSDEGTRSAVIALLRRPLLLLLALVILLYVGAEIGVSAWVAEYFVGVFAVPISAGPHAVAVFWGGILCGRLLASALYHGRRQAIFLLNLATVGAVGVTLAVLSSSAAVAMAGFFTAGLGLSCVYPVVMTLTGHCFRNEQSLAIGVVGAAGGIGSFVCPYVMAGIADRYGIARGFWFYEVVALAMVAAAAAVLVAATRTGEGQRAAA